MSAPQTTPTTEASTEVSAPTTTAAPAVAPAPATAAPAVPAPATAAPAAAPFVPGPKFHPPPPPPRKPIAYACRKCRRRIFTAEECVPHDADKDAAGHKSFKGKDYHEQKALLEQGLECTSAFLDPSETPWVEHQQDDMLPDDIVCPHCKCKLGSRSWIGTQCSCGAWVVPAFKVLHSKVDPLYI